jgi:hypothetical protein
MPSRHRPGRQPIDVAPRQVVRVLVVAAEHDLVGMAGDEGVKRVEIARRRAFPDQDAHAGGEFVPGLLQAGALVVGADARLGVTPRLFPRQAGGVAVHRQAQAPGQGDLGHDGGITRQHGREIHHFGKVEEAVVAQEAPQFLQAQLGPGRLEGRGRHARGRAEEHPEGYPPDVLQHEAHPLQAQHVGDLVGVGDAGHRAVAAGQAGEFRRHQHGTFHMHVGVHETRYQVTQAGIFRPARLDSRDDAILPDHSAGGDAAFRDMDDVGGAGSGKLVHCHALRWKRPGSAQVFSW